VGRTREVRLTSVREEVAREVINRDVLALFGNSLDRTHTLRLDHEHNLLLHTTADFGRSILADFGRKYLYST